MANFSTVPPAALKRTVSSSGDLLSSRDDSSLEPAPTASTGVTTGQLLLALLSFAALLGTVFGLGLVVWCCCKAQNDNVQNNGNAPTVGAAERRHGSSGTTHGASGVSDGDGAGTRSINHAADQGAVVVRGAVNNKGGQAPSESGVISPVEGGSGVDETGVVTQAGFSQDGKIESEDEGDDKKDGKDESSLGTKSKGINKKNTKIATIATVGATLSGVAAVGAGYSAVKRWDWMGDHLKFTQHEPLPRYHFTWKEYTTCDKVTDMEFLFCSFLSLVCIFLMVLCIWKAYRACEANAGDEGAEDGM